MRSINLDRRSFLELAAMSLAATQLGAIGAARAEPASPTDIRPFRVDFSDADLADLRRRITHTRWPQRETVSDDSQGVPLAMMQDLAQYWGTAYDWRPCERKLNALPNFVTEIDGVVIHFIHVRSKHPGALPLIVTHGWPGSIIEQLKIIDPLTNPTAHGGNASDAFDLVIPSIPGYGFSGKPTATGWDPARIARAWIVLMQRVGYTRYVAQGGDWGSPISELMAIAAPPELLAIHVNLPGTVPPDIAKALADGDPPPANLLPDERHAYEQLAFTFAKKRAYASMMGTRPQTLYALTDSPVGLAAFLMDHGDGYGQPASSITSAVLGRTVNGHSAGDLTRDDVLDNITLYWLTNTGVSSARLYWENKINLYNAFNVALPTAITVFPGESYQAPKSWAERAFQKLIYFNVADKGGHFAAWEQPQLFAEEMRAAFRSFRTSN
jgi:pimeloyl-ACP methyl ester carboxylesterase